MTSATEGSPKTPGDNAKGDNADGARGGDTPNFSAHGLSVSSRVWGEVDGEEVSDGHECSLFVYSNLFFTMEYGVRHLRVIGL